MSVESEPLINLDAEGVVESLVAQQRVPFFIEVESSGRYARGLREFVCIVPPAGTQFGDGWRRKYGLVDALAIEFVSPEGNVRGSAYWEVVGEQRMGGIKERIQGTKKA